MSYIESHVAEEIILKFGYEQHDITHDYFHYKATKEALIESPNMAKYLLMNAPRHYDKIGHAYPRDEFIDLLHTYLIGIDDTVGEKIYAILSEANQSKD